MWHHLERLAEAAEAWAAANCSVGIRLDEWVEQDYGIEIAMHDRSLGSGASLRTLCLRDKLARLREFAGVTFPDEQHRYQWWSPVVAKGATRTMFDELCSEWAGEGRSPSSSATRSTRAVRPSSSSTPDRTLATSEPAYRMLEGFTRLRGEKPRL